ncbi:hypothetical protein MCEGE14_01603 [Burkholderiaceae bacterium]
MFTLFHGYSGSIMEMTEFHCPICKLLLVDEWAMAKRFLSND